jgi:phage-related protein
MKGLIWLHGRVDSPPFSEKSLTDVGAFLFKLRQGVKLSMPVSRPMTAVAPGCHELRVPDRNLSWRIVYFVGAQEIVVLDVFAKKTPKTPSCILVNCRRRLRVYLASH